MSTETANDDFAGDDLQIPEGQFAVWGVAHAYPERADALEAIYSQTMRNALTEPGSFHYCICRIDKSNLFHFFEVYASKAAFDAHNEQPIIGTIFSRGLMKGCTDVAFAVPSSMPSPRDPVPTGNAGDVDDGKYQAYLDGLGPLPDEEFAIYGTVKANSQHAAQMFANVSKLANAETGVLYYFVLRDSEDESKFHLFERYAGKSAFERLHSKPIMRRLIAGGFLKDGKMTVATPIPLAT